MRSLSLASALSLLSVVPYLAFAQDVSIRDVVKAFEDADIPADLGIKFDPSALVQVTFPLPSRKGVTVKAGVQLPRNVTAEPPSFSLLGLRQFERGPFVVAVVDPDAPTPEDTSVSQVRHGLAGNFYLGERVDRTLVNSTAAVTEWLQPSPPSYSSAHRYIFLVYKQPAGFNKQTLVTPETSLINFNISSFAKEVGLGHPIAGTFMIVAPDAPAA